MSKKLKEYTLLIDALTVSEFSDKKTCPASALRRVFLGENLSIFSQELQTKVLLLLATYRKLLKAVQMDLSNLDIVYSDGNRRHWSKAHEASLKKVIAGKFQLKELEVFSLPLYLNTRQFLNCLPISFVQQLVEWLPPVVSGNFLIESILGGFIAQQRLPLNIVKVRCLTKTVKPYFHLADFLLLLPLLESLYQRYQHEIVCCAPSVPLALALTDFKRAWVYRMRQVL